MRSIAWRTRWTTPDGPPLVGRATEAFIDRASVDWGALLSRARTPRDRVFFERLSLLDRLRDAPTRGPCACAPLPSLLARFVVALASIQIVWGFAAVGLALTNGETVPNRTPQGVLAAGFAVAAVVLGLARPLDPRRLFLLAIFAIAGSTFARGMLTCLPGTWSPPLDAAVHGIVLEAFIPACVWQFALHFPRVQRFTAFDVLARRVTTTAWLLGGLLLGLGLIASHAIDEAPFAYLLRDSPNRARWYLVTLALIPAMGVILVRSRRAPVAERGRVAGLACALAVGSGPFCLFAVARIMVPGVDEWFITARSSERAWLEGLILASLAATPILCTGAVIVDRPFELEAIFRQRPLSAVPRRLFRRAVDHREQLIIAMERVRLARGTREIIDTLRLALRDGLGVRTVRVLRPDREGSFRAWPDDSIRLAEDAALVAILRDTARPIDLSPDGVLLALLPPTDREWVLLHDVQVATALERRDGAIVAVVLLGAKRDGTRFTRRDRWLVRTLATAAAAAWDVDLASHEPDTPTRLTSRRLIAQSEAAFECPHCGMVGDSPPLPCHHGPHAVLASLPRQLAGMFLVRRRLGAGGMGVVYLARDQRLGRDVALKTLPRLGPGGVTRLRAEAQAMAALNHESLATIYGLELWRRTPVLVVEYLPNGTLARRLATGPLSPREAVGLGIRLAEALAYMHARGVLHRDLKPSNIAFTATGQPKLLDLGLATLITPATNADPRRKGTNDTPDVTDRFVGTLAYLPPEAYHGIAPTPAFDLWALSVTMLVAITGVNPFVAPDHGRTRQRVATVDATTIRARLPASVPALHTFLARALARDPERRYHTSEDMLAALHSARLSLTPRRRCSDARSRGSADRAGRQWRP